jgi:hypothetical protein
LSLPYISHPNIIFVSNAAAYLLGEPLRRLHSQGRLLTFPENIRLEWKWIAITNGLAYNDEILITSVKSVIVHTQEPVL